MNPCSECGLPTRSRFGICARQTCKAAYSRVRHRDWRRAVGPDHANAKDRAWYARNREAQRQRVRTYRLANLEKVRAYHRAARAKEAAWLRSFKIGKPCTDCGLECTEVNYPAFDWDHRPGVIKSFAISQAFRQRRSEEEILAEIAKCDLRCRNCHGIITHLRRMENK